MDDTSNKEIRYPSRREALKTLIAATGAIAISSLPTRWETPVIEVGNLPAHAQASEPILGTGDLQATLTWDTGNPNANNCGVGGSAQGAIDIDLHVVEPGGTRVYFANKTGPTAVLDFDNQRAFGPENIFVANGQAAAGTYQIQVAYFCGNGSPTTATIVVRVFVDTPQEQSATFSRTLTTQDSTVAINVARVTFPAGTIQEVTGTTPIPLESQGAAKG